MTSIAVAIGQQAAYYLSSERQRYCVDWWHEVLVSGVDHLHVRFRDIPQSVAKASLGKNFPGWRPEQMSFEQVVKWFASDHQKPVLIDYEKPLLDEKDAAGCEPKGYVMGLNSLTDYWDTEWHQFDDWRREKEGGLSRKPYRDYAIRVQGEVLHSLNANFATAWARAQNGSPAKAGGNLPEVRKSWKAQSYGEAITTGHRCQIVRTQAEENDATAWESYQLAISNANRYIYAENQYFQLDNWSQAIKQIRQAQLQGYQKAGQGKGGALPLYVFVVIPKPEKKGMIPRTYSALAELGGGDGLAAYHGDVLEARKLQDAQQALKPPQAPAAPTPRPEPMVRPDVPLTNIKSYTANVLGQAWDYASGKAAQAAGETADVALYAKQQAQYAVDRVVYERKQEYYADQLSRIGNKPGGGLKLEQARRYGDVDKIKAELEKLQIKPLFAMLESFDRNNVTRSQNPDDRYREIYIHSKVMLVDDVFTTLGSANLNVRSMAADSELNLITEEHEGFTLPLRKRIWGSLAGRDLDGGGGSREEIADVYKKWKSRMKNNVGSLKKECKPFENDSFIVPFKDNNLPYYIVG